MNAHYPGRILLSEANQWPEECAPILAMATIFHMAFHFPVIAAPVHCPAQAPGAPLAWILERTPPIPPNCQWCTFLRNHDELTLEMVTEAERQWMWQEYAPEPRMRLTGESSPPPGAVAG